MYFRSGRSAGKSKNLPYSMIAKACNDNFSILVIRETFESLKNTTYNQVIECLDDMGVPYKATKNPLEIELLTNAKHNPRIFFKGLDKPSKLKSWASNPKTRMIWFEEATEIKDKMKVDHVKMSIREGERYYIFSYNPEVGDHWLKTLEENIDTNSSELVVASPFDNPYNDKIFWDEMNVIRNIDENLYNHYAHGEWIDMGGKVYKLQNFNKLTETDDSYMRINIGVDLGSVDPTTFVACGITDQFREVHILDNYVDDHQNGIKDWNETMEDFKRFYTAIAKRYNTTPFVYVENAAQGNKFVQMLLNAGIYTAREVKKTPIEQRIMFWNYMLSTGILKVDPNLAIWKELSQIAYDDKGKRMDRNDHSINAGEYALEADTQYINFLGDKTWL